MARKCQLGKQIHQNNKVFSTNDRQGMMSRSMNKDKSFSTVCKSIMTECWYTVVNNRDAIKSSNPSNSSGRSNQRNAYNSNDASNSRDAINSTAVTTAKAGTPLNRAD